MDGRNKRDQTEYGAVSGQPIKKPRSNATLNPHSQKHEDERAKAKATKKTQIGKGIRSETY
jgi:hypothetical protein